MSPCSLALVNLCNELFQFCILNFSLIMLMECCAKLQVDCQAMQIIIITILCEQSGLLLQCFNKFPLSHITIQGYNST